MSPKLNIINNFLEGNSRKETIPAKNIKPIKQANTRKIQHQQIDHFPDAEKTSELDLMQIAVVEDYWDEEVSN